MKKQKIDQPKVAKRVPRPKMPVQNFKSGDLNPQKPSYMAHIGNMKEPVIFKDPLNQAAKVREYEEK